MVDIVRFKCNNNNLFTDFIDIQLIAQNIEKMTEDRNKIKN